MLAPEEVIRKNSATLLAHFKEIDLSAESKTNDERAHAVAWSLGQMSKLPIADISSNVLNDDIVFSTITDKGKRAFFVVTDSGTIVCMPVDEEDNNNNFDSFTQHYLDILDHPDDRLLEER